MCQIVRILYTENIVGIEFLSLFIHLGYEKEKNNSQEKIFLCLTLSDSGNVFHTISNDLADESGK